MPVGQDLARDKRRILERAEPENQVDTLSDMIDEPVGNKDLDTNAGIRCLKCADQRRQ